MRRDTIAAVIGATLGLAISLFVLVYLPMSANHAECGKVTLCHPERKARP